MKLHDFNNLLHKLKQECGSLDFENENDIGTASFHHEHFWFSFNGKLLFKQKSLRTFRRKLMFEVESKNISLNEELA